MDRIFKILFYNGLSKESYYNVIPMAREDNRKNLVVFSIMGFCAFTFALSVQCMSNFGMNVAGTAIIALGFLVIFVLSSTIAARIKGILSDVLAYLFTAMLLAAGMYAGLSQPQERTTLLLAFFIFSAVMFSLKLGLFFIIIGVTELIYLFGIYYSQTGNVYVTNKTNSLIFFAVGVLTATHIMKIKFKKLEADYTNKFLIEMDPLTGAYNRRSFELELDRVRNEKIPVAICAFDINGLKKVNDNIGHMAGDELIVGAADCITKVFSKYGKVFRTGGDEFMAILDHDFSDIDGLLAEYKAVEANWKGKLIDSIHVSCGIATVDHDFDARLTEALQLADKLMYEEKRRYYGS